MQEGKGSARAAGVYAALMTPRRPDSAEADTAALFEYLDKVSATGVNGLVFFGSTGEFIHFDSEERMRVLSLAAKRSRIPVLVNVSHSTLAGALALAEHAMDSGAAGLLLMPPYFYGFEDDIVAEFYKRFIEAAPGAASTYLYNLPQCTAAISSELAQRLLSSGAFAGIKDSSGDWNLFQSIAGLRNRAQFQLLAGNEAIYLQALLAGADGSVSGVASALPELPVAIYHAVKADDLETARRLSERLEEIMGWLARFPPVVALKKVTQARKWMPLELAVPISPHKMEELRRFGQWLEEWLPVTLAECAAAPVVRT